MALANEALKKLHKFLEGTPCGGDLAELLDQAMAHQANQPHQQMAKQQARLVEAKADLLELQVAERRGELVKVSDVKKQVEFHFDSMRVQVPEWTTCLAMGVDVAQGGDSSHIEVMTYKKWQARRETETQSVQADRLKRAHEDARRIREAEEWGFLRGKRVALEAVERRWRSVRAWSSPSYDDAMCAAVEEIKGIALPKVEG